MFFKAEELQALFLVSFLSECVIMSHERGLSLDWHGSPISRLESV